jgi:transcriptional regulator with XRE-family HTH domain
MHMESSWYSKTDSQIISAIGDRIKIYRIYNNLTQQLLAEQTGINRCTIRDLENGKSINISSLIPLLRRLNLLEALDNSLPDPDKNPILAYNFKNRKRVKIISQKK